MNDNTPATTIAVAVQAVASYCTELPDEEDNEVSNTAIDIAATANVMMMNSSLSLSLAGSSSSSINNDDFNDSIGSIRRTCSSWCGTTVAQKLLSERIDSPSLNTPQTKKKKSSLRVRMKCNNSNSNSNSMNNTDYISSALSLTSLSETTRDDDDDDCCVGQQQQGGNQLTSTSISPSTSTHDTSTNTNTRATRNNNNKSTTTTLVRFSRRVKVRKTRSHLDYTPHQIKNCWYQQYEIDQIKSNCLYEIKQFQKQEKKKKMEKEKRKKKQQQQEQQRSGRTRSSEEKSTVVLSTCKEGDGEEAEDQDQDKEVSHIENHENKDYVNQEASTRSTRTHARRAHTRTTINIVAVADDDTSSCSYSYCMRGLESYEPLAYERKKRLRNKASQIVFDIEDDGGDELTIAEYYYAITKKYSLVAHIIALQDERDAIDT